MSILRYRTHYRPVSRLASLQDEVNRLFDFSSLNRDFVLFSGWSPALDLFDEKDQVVVRLEAPGLKKEDFHIALEDGVLSLSGERKAEGEAAKAFRSERPVGKFVRHVNLPAPVDGGNVKATYDDGVLTVTLPKAEETKPRTIEING